MKRHLTRPFLLSAVAMLTLGAAAFTRAEPVAKPTARWQQAFDEFAAADRRGLPASGGVLFVGSSSIRLWDHLEQDFQEMPVVIKRGFGGSRLSDCSDNLARLVLPYKPRDVIVYAGDNDLAEAQRRPTCSPVSSVSSTACNASCRRRASPTSRSSRAPCASR
jgi:hypothetical protein